MFNLPLHPIVVHFPIAIGSIMPIAMGFVIFGIRRWQWPTQTWWLVILLQGIVFASALTALKTGEMEEDHAEKKVSEQLIHEHEEWGEKVPVTAGIVFALTLLPLWIRKKSKALMMTSLVASIGLVVVLIFTGHSGGKMVYNQALNPPGAASTTEDE